MLQSFVSINFDSTVFTWVLQRTEKGITLKAMLHVFMLLYYCFC